MNFRKRTLIPLAFLVLAAGYMSPTKRDFAYPSRTKDQYTRVRRVAVFPLENYSNTKDAEKMIDSLMTTALREIEVFDQVEDTRFVRDTCQKSVQDRQARPACGAFAEVVSHGDRELPPDETMNAGASPDPSPPFAPAGAGDADPQETREWLEALAAVQRTQGPQRVAFLLDRLAEIGRQPASAGNRCAARRTSTPSRSNDSRRSSI